MKFIVYEDNQGKFRWRLVGASGLTVANSGEGYNGIGNVRRALKAFKHYVADAKVVEESHARQTLDP